MVYIDRCKAAKEAIDIEALAELRLGEEIGEGMDSAFQTLGRLSIHGHPEYVGLKLPHREPAIRRYIDEVSQINLFTAHEGQLLRKVPAFMCHVRVEGIDIDAALMEDVSQGNQKPVKPCEASASTREQLYLPFSHLGTVDSVLRSETLDVTTAYCVDGEERLLDFTPSPINWDVGLHELLEKHREAVRENIDDLTIVIPPDSNLGAELRLMYGPIMG